MLRMCIEPPSEAGAYYDSVLSKTGKAFGVSDMQNITNHPVKNIECSYGMKQLVLSPTRKTHASSSLLNVILSITYASQVLKFSRLP